MGVFIVQYFVVFGVNYFSMPDFVVGNFSRVFVFNIHHSSRGGCLHRFCLFTNVFSLTMFHICLVLISHLLVSVILAGLVLDASGQYGPLYTLQSPCVVVVSVFRFCLCSWSAISSVSSLALEALSRDFFARNDHHCSIVELWPFSSVHTLSATGHHCQAYLCEN